ncbi:MAG: TOBE domain-containing protein, partial [Pseudomonadota bacterium]
ADRGQSRDPQVFLFDEPLSNLDAALRVQTRVEIARLHEELASTMIYVTHDQVEAMTLADKIVVLQGGVIEQVGSPMELYNTPANLFVAGFIGSPNMNIFDADASGGKAVVEGGGVALEGVSAEGKLKLGVRPEHLRAVAASDAFISPRLQLVEKLGEYALAHMVTESGSPLTVKFEEPPSAAKGDAIPLGFDSSRAHLFSAADGMRL